MTRDEINLAKSAPVSPVPTPGSHSLSEAAATPEVAPEAAPETVPESAPEASLAADHLASLLSIIDGSVCAQDSAIIDGAFFRSIGVRADRYITPEQHARIGAAARAARSGASGFIPNRKADDELEDKIRALMRAAHGIDRLRRIGVGRWVDNGHLMSHARCSYLPRSHGWINIQVGADNKAHLAVVGLLWSNDVTEASSHQRLRAKARFNHIRDKALRQEGVERLLQIWIPHRLETTAEDEDDMSPTEKQAELVDVITDFDQIIHAQNLVYELENDGGEPRLIWRPRQVA